VLEVTEHHTAMRDLPFVESPNLNLLKGRHDWAATEDIGVAHQPCPVAIDLPTIALEAESVVLIRTHLAAVFESRPALLARRTQAPATVRATLIFAACHRIPPDRSGFAVFFDALRIFGRVDRPGHTPDVRP
jgi:hypothetical protein